MSEKIPCEDCICLAICKCKLLKSYAYSTYLLRGECSILKKFLVRDGFLQFGLEIKVAKFLVSYSEWARYNFRNRKNENTM